MFGAQMLGRIAAALEALTSDEAQQRQRSIDVELQHICQHVAALTKAMEVNTVATRALTEGMTVHRWRLERVDAKLAWLDELIAERTGERPDERHQLLRLRAGQPRTGGQTG